MKAHDQTPTTEVSERPDAPVTPVVALERAHTRFIELWGRMAASWGVPRSMAEVHALLFVDGGMLNTDQLMSRLGISRGNASMTTRTLVEWGIVTRVHNREDRRDYFRAEQDVWTLFATVIRVRKRREIDPLMGLVEECRALASGAGPGCGCAETAARAAELERKLRDIASFITTFDTLAETYLASGGDGIAGAFGTLGERAP
ncbi:MAG: GbsR/MarR family transcriptional regulator [Phycisphaerales bacterium]